MSTLRSRPDAETISLARATEDAPVPTSIPNSIPSGPEFPPAEGLGSLAELLNEQAPGAARGGIVCPCCRGHARRVVRARPGGASRWVAVCAICAGRLLAGRPGTVVGGRVRPRLRRAG